MRKCSARWASLNRQKRNSLSPVLPCRRESSATDLWPPGLESDRRRPRTHRLDPSVDFHPRSSPIMTSTPGWMPSVWPAGRCNCQQPRKDSQPCSRCPRHCRRPGWPPGFGPGRSGSTRSGTRCLGAEEGGTRASCPPIQADTQRGSTRENQSAHRSSVWRVNAIMAKTMEPFKVNRADGS